MRVMICIYSYISATWDSAQTKILFAGPSLGLCSNGDAHRLRGRKRRYSRPLFLYVWQTIRRS